MAPQDSTGHLTTEQLFQQHAGFVARFLTRLGVPREALEDAIQEVFLVVHRNGGYRPGAAKPTSYLANLAVYAAASHRRKQGVARSRHSDAVVEHMPSPSEDPAHALQVRQDLQRLQLALDRLPEDLRTTLLLVDMEEQSAVSVAAALGCPVGTIYWRVHQARKRLQSSLRAIDAARSRPEPTAPPLEGRTAPSRSLVVLFGLDGYRRSEAARLLRLAREHTGNELSLDELLRQHQALIEAGAELPAWAASCAPRAATLLGLIGVGPIAGLSATVATVAAVLFVTSGAPNAPTNRAWASAPGQPALPRADAQATRTSAATALAAPAASELPSAPAVRRDGLATTKAAARASVSKAPEPRVRASLLPTERAIPAAEAASGLADGDRPLRPVRSSDRKIARKQVTGSASPRPAAERSAAMAASTPAPHDRVAATTAAGPREVPARATASTEARPPAAARVRRPEASAPDTSEAALSEMRAVAQAENLLTRDPERTLALTRAMRTRFPAGYFAEERAYLEVMALSALGRTAELQQRAAAFLSAHPDGLYSGRVRKALSGAGD